VIVTSSILRVVTRSMSAIGGGGETRRFFSAVSEYNFARVCVTVSHIPQLMSDLCYSSAVIALTTAFPSRQSVTLRSRCYFRPNRRWKGDTKACW